MGVQSSPQLCWIVCHSVGLTEVTTDTATQATPPTIISSQYQLNKQSEESGEFISIK